ncbi:SAM-dependent methyltransferase [Pseudohongiella spirulinae]|uniref:Transcriptional regulator n=1 Tax=Pseudohongiella spirulinae TaxID=1249552 RepID=A0A0S2K9W9_9GAMM|nr:SAM-dependent methyltransferase [Pseudohongiella spirulinae]ALO44878.1 Transcriptional regulator [Pseudohongiella spirulinae]
MITLRPIGYVYGGRKDLQDDNWANVSSRIEMCDDFAAEALDGIEEFSHIEVIFHFNKVTEEEIERGARHPRGNSSWPRVGIFSQRGKNRPNRLGLSIAKLVSRNGKNITVLGLDAIVGTPVLDIKPVMAEFLPREKIHQPLWSQELMRYYWHSE